eukprot:2317884-Amphidinium_carterae.1
MSQEQQCQYEKHCVGRDALEDPLDLLQLLELLHMGTLVCSWVWWWQGDEVPGAALAAQRWPV